MHLDRERVLGPAVLVIGIIALASLVLSSVLFVQLSRTRDDLRRVEQGAAFVTLQVDAIRERLGSAAPGTIATLDEAISALETIEEDGIELTLDVDDTVALDTELPLAGEVTVPVELTIPIREVIETTIEVQGPLGVHVPIDVRVPVDLDVPVDTEVRAQLSGSVPVATTLPLRLELPVRLDPNGSGLETFAGSLREALLLLRGLLQDLE